MAGIGGAALGGLDSARERGGSRVFAKLVVSGTDRLRGRRITLRDDPLAYATAKAVGGALVAGIVGNSRMMVSSGEPNPHQGPPDGSPVAAAVRIR